MECPPRLGLEISGSSIVGGPGDGDGLGRGDIALAPTVLVIPGRPAGVMTRTIMRQHTATKMQIRMSPDLGQQVKTVSPELPSFTDLLQAVV